MGGDTIFMKIRIVLTRLAAAAAFAASTATAVIVTDAAHAGQPATGVLASAPAAAEAASISVGPHRFYRYGYRGGVWTRVGFYYGYAPGYIPGGYYVGYAPPPYYAAAYYGPYPAYGYGYYHYGYYGYRGYYGRPWYGHGYYGRGYYGHGWRR